MNREIAAVRRGMFAVLYDVIGDSAVIVRFEEIDDSVSAGKSYVGDAPETKLHGAGSVGWRCEAVSQISLCRVIFVSRILGCGYLGAGCGVLEDEIPRARGCH